MSSFKAFFQAVKSYEESVHAFARSRQIPSDEKITSFRTVAEGLPEHKAIVIAMADSLATIRQKALAAGVNSRDMGSTSMADMLQWAVDALVSVISIIPENKPEMKAARVKLVKERDILYAIKGRLVAVGETPVFQFATLLLGMSGSAANTRRQ
jgi:hypothetical protein